jgi:general secretion pathway protein L
VHPTWLLIPETDAGVAPDAANCRWLRSDRPDTVHAGTLATFAAGRDAALPVTLLLDDNDLLVTGIDTPVRNARQLQKALPYLVEDAIAGDIEQMHVASAARLGGNRLQVAVMERSRLAARLQQLNAAGIEPALVTSAGLLVEPPASGCRLLAGGTTALMVGSDGTVLRLAADDVAQLLPPDEQPVEIVAAIGDLPPALALHGEARIGGSAETVLAGLLDARRGNVPNLRQGDFAQRESSRIDLGFDVRPLLWLAASCAVLVFGFYTAETVALSRQADAVRTAQEELYRAVFPGAQNVSNPRAQMEGRLRGAAAGGGGFVHLAAETAGVLRAQRDGGTALEARHLGYEAREGKLRLDVQAPSLEDLEKFAAAVEARGIAVEMGAAVAGEGGTYKARLSLGGGA